MYNYILQPPSFYKVGLYIRLSEADFDKSFESESESIVNQRNLLMSYIKQNNFTFINEYVDDGYTGTNFERPAFIRMLKDIENNIINTVITKDLSRLGRDYIKCGYYIEQYFPSKKIRYISILDQIDTFLESANNDIAPFKALFNDMASKDTSKKIRSILKSKKEQGKFIGSEPCYGYMRDPLDKGHLIPNPEYAPIVKKIFEMADNGVGISEIVSHLNFLGIKTPSSLKRKNINSKVYNETWTISSVNKILKNRMYTGDMVQNVQTKLSYKSMKKIALEKNFWIIVENTHEPLVNKTVYERIQKSPYRTRKTYKNRDKRLFENLIYCKECRNTLTITYRKNKNYWTVNCNKYSRDPKRRLCEPHFIPYDKLETALIEKIKTTCKKYLDSINIKSLAEEVSKENLYIKSNIEEKNILILRINDLQRKVDMLYEDRFKGNISTDSYLRLSTDVEKNLKLTKNRLEEIKKQEEVLPNIIKDIKNYEKEIKKLLDIENPSRELLKTIIDKICIDKDKNIEIMYKFRNF